MPGDKSQINARTAAAIPPHCKAPSRSPFLNPALTNVICTMANMISTPKGRVQVRCAPKALVYQLVSQPKRENDKPMPSETNMDGTMRLATVR